jgi:copper chaperone
MNIFTPLNQKTSVMSRFIWIPLLCILAITGCKNQLKDGNVTSGVEIDSTRLVTVKYSVEGMSCTGCENTINQAVMEIPGVTSATSSFTEKYTLVTFDSALVDMHQVKKAVDDKGYELKGIFMESSPSQNP